MYREEKVKGQEWEECRLEKIELPRPKPHPLLVAMGDIPVCTILVNVCTRACVFVLQVERYVLNVVKRIKSR